jgi:hypothetical protein
MAQDLAKSVFPSPLPNAGLPSYLFTTSLPVKNRPLLFKNKYGTYFAVRHPIEPGIF